jgi:hypothetical protein
MLFCECREQRSRQKKRVKWPGNRFPGRDAEGLIESVNATAFIGTDPKA